MFFLFRELAGWGLLGCALYLVWTAVGFIDNRQVIEASGVLFACLIVMRAGMLLIRMNTIARIAQQTTDSASGSDGAAS